MADYFSEYSSFIGNKGLPSPADTPYETPAFIRSKRSSRATTVGSRSRDPSQSPPPLPPDATDFVDKTRDGRYTALDPRRFTPTLHASLVAEILSLRRDLDSKNHLVENLESSLAVVKNDNESLTDKLASSAKEVRVARTQVQQMESGTYEALESIATERNAAQTVANDLRLKLEVAQKKVKMQDDNADRVQSVWEREKESWQIERRELQRRIHVTETRLRTFVDEMVTQQAAQEPHPRTEEVEDDINTKDSGLGDESDNEGVKSASIRHRRDMSHASFKSSRSRHSVQDSFGRNLQTPDLLAKTNGHSLADELDFADEDEDMEEDQDNDDIDYHDTIRGTMDSRQSNYDVEAKARRVLGISDDLPPSPIRSKTPTTILSGPRSPSRSSRTVEDSPRKVVENGFLPPLHEEDAERSLSNGIKPQYVDTGYQPSPPPSPVLAAQKQEQLTPVIVVEDEPPQVSQPAAQYLPVSSGRSTPMSPPETPVVDEERKWNDKDSTKAVYADMSTQTDEQAKVATANRNSLQLPDLVPSIAIHPPTSRPSTPRPYVLPPHHKNATTQVDLSWSGVDASVQTEEIRVDRRAVKLPAHLLPSYLSTLPEPTRHAPSEVGDGVATIFSSKTFSATAPAVQPPTAPSPTEPVNGTLSRDSSAKDLKSMPLKAISLPKPTLAPAIAMAESSSTKAHGPLNRSAQFGVSHDNHASRMLANFDDDSEASENEEFEKSRAAIVSMHRPTARYTTSEHPRNVPEDKELSPERRPVTSESVDGAAPAPSIASSREARDGQRLRKRPPPKLKTYASLRSRSPSFGSVASSSFSAQSGMPPFPIPTRSSSRQVPFSHSEGSCSPSVDPFVNRSYRSGRSHHTRQQSLRKVQSSTSIRHAAKTKVSPRKGRRRMRSPDLTPVQSMAFESPAPTNFPIPELPTPLQRGPGSDYQWGSVASAGPESLPPTDESGMVDAIAATMVGEWMWKYIRKRKSFGVGESTEDFAQATQDGTVDLPGIGTRHKRWVWLSPYERTIMWDSKQPMSGTALLGKKGRKREFYIPSTMMTLTSNSHHTVGSGCPRRHPLAKEARARNCLQALHPYLDAGTSTQIHDHFSRKTRFVDDSTHLPGRVESTTIFTTATTTRACHPTPSTTSSTNPSSKARITILRTSQHQRLRAAREGQERANWSCR